MEPLAHFDAEFSFEKSVNILSQISRRLVHPNHPLLKYVDQKNWKFLATAAVDYSSHLDSSTVRPERQLLALFQKNASLPLGIDRKKVAKDKMLSAERDCLVMNYRLRNMNLNPFVGADSAFIYKVQRKIDSILGPCPSLDQLHFGFGPGSNVGTKRLTSARQKMAVKPTYTASAAGIVDYLRVEFPHWEFLHKAELTDYGKLAFVPKDAKTDRSIETQPMINSFVQLGIGSYMKRRLEAHGCDLYKGQALNAELARQGSLHGTFATLDLSSASDTISYLLVHELLPNAWFELLDSVRTSQLKTKEGLIPLQRFSAMGNGYTFELESLIFYAVACVVSDGRSCHVYGDDIIVETDVADEVARRLQMFGFTINHGKSYTEGPFRESCGKDFFDGVDVRPVYVKGLLSYKELFRLHNFFFRRGQAYLADVVRRHIPQRLRVITGPDGYGDGHLLSHTPRLVPHGRKHGYAGWTFQTHTRKPLSSKDKSVTGSLRSDYAAYLYGAWKSAHQWWEPSPPSSKTMYIERGGLEYRLKRVYTLRS